MGMDRIEGETDEQARERLANLTAPMLNAISSPDEATTAVFLHANRAADLGLSIEMCFGAFGIAIARAGYAEGAPEEAFLLDQLEVHAPIAYGAAGRAKGAPEDDVEAAAEAKRDAEAKALAEAVMRGAKETKAKPWWKFW